MASTATTTRRGGLQAAVLPRRARDFLELEVLQTTLDLRHQCGELLFVEPRNIDRRPVFIAEWVVRQSHLARKAIQEQ